MLDAFMQDLRYAARSLRRTPGLVITITLTLALAIGANSAVFALLDRLFLRPPADVANPASLRRLYIRDTYSFGAVTRGLFDYREFLQLDSGLTPLARLAAYTAPDSVRIGSGDHAGVARLVYATQSLFGVLGIRPQLGRFFTADEDRMGDGAQVAVISDTFWRRHFGAEHSPLGDTLLLDDTRYTVVGVAPREFTGVDLDAADVWVPLATMRARPIGDQPWYASWRSGYYIAVLARELPGASDASISARATTLRRRGGGGEQFVDTTATALTGPVLAALGPATDKPQEIGISTRIGAVVLIMLLIACANVANLLLARTVQRRREIAVRLALGISRRRLIAQLLTESVLLALVAAVAALLVAWWAGTALRAALMPATHWASGPIDLEIIAFTAAIALGTGLLAGLAPALQASNRDLNSALKSGEREGAFGRSWLRVTLIVAQAALSVVLLAGAGFFIRSLKNVQAIDLGFDADRIVFGQVLFEDPGCNCRVQSPPDDRAADLSTSLSVVAERLARRPDVQNVALASDAPMAGFAYTTIHLPGTDSIPRLHGDAPSQIAVSPSYFATTGIRLKHGRLFTTDDRAGAPPVIVVSETMAKVVWPGAEPLGKCLMLFPGRSPCYSVVGVVADIHRREVIEKPTMQYYVPLAQAPLGRNWTRQIIARAAPPATAVVAEAMRRELARVLPDAEPRVLALDQLLAPQLRPWRLGAMLFATFGALALVVATLGVYSIVGFMVRQRRREMGVRLALGARTSDLLRLIVGAGTRAVAAGVLAGVVLTLLLGRTVEALLYGTTAHDPVVLAIVAIVLLAAATVASLVPARWAAQVDPAEVLRAE